jgi:hypothetical protein
VGPARVAGARRRDFARHQAWMIRSYAIGPVAGLTLTQERPTAPPRYAAQESTRPRCTDSSPTCATLLSVRVLDEPGQ